MIPYVNSSFGIRILARVHGSALYKSILPALISTIVYITIVFTIDGIELEDEIFIHPYPMQALVTAFTFLLVFRANYSYNRWWEAYTAVYLMHSKWLDMATEIAAFHYQSKRYDDYKPPSFGAYPDIQCLEFRDSLSQIVRPKDGVGVSSVRNHEAGENAAGLTPPNSVAGNMLTPPSSPTKQNRIILTPTVRTRHTSAPTLTDLMQQMDACEAEEEQMLQQSLITDRGIDDSHDGSEDNAHMCSAEIDGMINHSKNDVEQIYFEKGEGSVSSSEKKKRSWFCKLKGRRPQSRFHQKSEKVGRHSSRANTPPVDLNTIANISRKSGVVNSSRKQQHKIKRRRSRHISVEAQPATARLFNQRKSIARRVESTAERSLDFYDRFDIKTGKQYSMFTAVSRKHLRDGNLDPDEVPPMLFLEECAHLLSLMSAVAFSTLRNDLPEAESPLTVFEPGLPWPLVDPDGYKAKVRKGWTQSKSQLYSVLQFALGRSRNDHARTLYNAARPFRVIGNVSDAEIEKLQEARGPQAKVSLISMWLLELISREYQAGSTGNVAAPIISRLYQFVSEGLAGYNQARKIAYIPFPFPHAQITTLFLLVVDFFVTPLLMSTFVTDVKLGIFLNLFSVLCFTGLHEVAREIENPFQNVPNDVPLNNYQAQFNEGLMVMFYGYHPDAYWIKRQGNDNDSCAVGTPSRDQNDRKELKSLARETNETDITRVHFKLQNQYDRKTTATSGDNELIVDLSSFDFDLRTNTSESDQNPSIESLTVVNDAANKPSTSLSVQIPRFNHEKEFESIRTNKIGSTKRDSNTSIIGNQTGNIPADDFLRNLMENKSNSVNSMGSFRRVLESDSTRRSTEDKIDARSSPVFFSNTKI